MFTDLVDADSQAVQTNQFLIVDNGTGAIIAPGGNLAFNELFLGMSHHFSPQKLSYIIASHADPDIIASLDRWLTSTPAKLVISRVWEWFVPHFTKVGKTEHWLIGVADAGGELPLGRSELWLLPAHFLHSEGNYHFYDLISRILFTGDLGVSMMSGEQAQTPVIDLCNHIALMEGFHKRYMVFSSPAFVDAHGSPTRCFDAGAAAWRAADRAGDWPVFLTGPSHCNAASTCSMSATTSCRRRPYPRRACSFRKDGHAMLIGPG